MSDAKQLTQPHQGPEPDATQRLTLDQKTMPLTPDPFSVDRGASSAEFTQLAAPIVDKTIPMTAQPTRPAPAPARAAKPPAPAIPAPVVAKPKPAKGRKRGFDWRLPLLALIILGGSAVVSLMAFLVVPLSSMSNTATPPATQTVSPVLPAVVTPPATATLGVDIQPWDGQQRFTILMMGIDKRPNDPGTAFRTDSMILVSIDPTTHSLGMLSIPRDLYVEIPKDSIIGSYGLQRVNAAYPIAELTKPGTGPQLAMQTVQYNLGIRVNSYIVYDFSAVTTAIDTIGGVDIDVPTAIYDPAYPDMYYGYDPLYIPAGHIHMDGALALKYARTRHESDDFARAKRQQQVIMAVRSKILNLNMLPTLLTRAPGLWNQLSGDIRSGLSFDQILRLAVYVKDIPQENIHQGVIDAGYVTPVVWQGMDVLVPERATIGTLLIKVFGPNYNQ